MVHIWMFGFQTLSEIQTCWNPNVLCVSQKSQLSEIQTCWNPNWLLFGFQTFTVFGLFFNIVIAFFLDLTVSYGARSNASNLFRYVEAFRKHGHKCSNINPVPINQKIRWLFHSILDCCKQSFNRLLDPPSQKSMV